MRSHIIVEQDPGEHLDSLSARAIAEKAANPQAKVEMEFRLSEYPDHPAMIEVTAVDTVGSLWSRMQVALSLATNMERDRRHRLELRCERIVEHLWNQNLHPQTIHELRPLLPLHGFTEPFDDDTLVRICYMLDDYAESCQQDDEETP